MAATTDFILGKIIPENPNRGIPYGMEPIQKWNAVTLDSYFLDTSTGATCSRALSVAVEGNVTFVQADGTTSTLFMLAGVWYPQKAYRVNTSMTTATGIQWGY